MTQQKKKRVLLCVGAVILLAIGVVVYVFSFPIRADGTNLKETIVDFYDKGRTTQTPTSSLELYQWVTLGNTHYVLMELEQQLGYVALEKNFAGRQKIRHMGWGDTSFRYGIVEEKGKRYVLFGGRNTGGQIARVTFTQGGLPYQRELTGEGHFFLCVQLQKGLEPEDGLDLETVRFYNEAGEDITDQYNLSSGGISG
jgi:hypothetical protein